MTEELAEVSLARYVLGWQTWGDRRIWVSRVTVGGDVGASQGEGKGSDRFIGEFHRESAGDQQVLTECGLLLELEDGSGRDH